MATDTGRCNHRLPVQVDGADPVLFFCTFDAGHPGDHGRAGNWGSIRWNNNLEVTGGRITHPYLRESIQRGGPEFAHYPSPQPDAPTEPSAEPWLPEKYILDIEDAIIADMEQQGPEPVKLDGYQAYHLPSGASLIPEVEHFLSLGYNYTIRGYFPESHPKGPCTLDEVEVLEDVLRMLKTSVAEEEPYAVAR